MAYEDLREFIEVLEKEGELLRVKEPLNPSLEISYFTTKVSKFKDQRNKALLFENPIKEDGSSYDIPVLTNAFGSEKRIKLALGYENLEEIGWKLYRILRPEVPTNFIEKLKKLPELKKLNDAIPKIVKKGKVQEVVKIGKEINLFEFPILKTWEKDAGPFITLPQVITKDPETGIRNVGMYRMQVIDEKTTAMHWQIHKHGHKHFLKAKKLGRKLPVAVVIGSDPVLTYVATAPLPDEVDEYLFAGIIREKAVKLVKGRTVDLEYPADAEIVLEGYVDPSEELFIEGPFGDHTGFYTPPAPYPKFHITAIVHRERPIYQATVVGKPPQEDKWIGYATERIFLPLLKFNLPEIVDIHIPAEGVFHNFVFVSINKMYPGHAYKVAYALLGMGLMALSKHIIVFDHWVNVHDIEEVLWIWGNNVDPSRDVLIVKGPIDVLDHSTNEVGFGGKMIIDATTKWKEEGYKRQWPETVGVPKEVKEKIEKILSKYF
jgi:4-hydroxy-3-polyprenylbenzoate decarboxylase